MQELCAIVLLTSIGWLPLAALAVAGLAIKYGRWIIPGLMLLAGMVFAHQGAFDSSAIQDILNSQTQYNSVALPAGGTMPPNVFSGGNDVYLLNTTATPGTVTTRTAAQIYADLTAQLGFPPSPGFDYALRITHTAAATLTLAAGTGVTFGSGTYTIATATFRDFIVIVNNANSITVQTTGVGTWS